MAELLAQFAQPVVGADGTQYRAQACGEETRNGLWEAWIEFVPLSGGAPIRSPRETTQPNRTHAEYWAGGLTQVYLEGALERALKPLIVRTVEPAQPLFEKPARGVTRVELPLPGHQAVLNPFSIFEKGEALLRQELGALSEWHLVNIINAHQLGNVAQDVLTRSSRAALVDLIVAAVRERAGT